MALLLYPAFATEPAPGELQAEFVDFAGLVVRASSPGELLLRARERLLATLKEAVDGDGWPTPSTLAQAKTRSGDGALLWVDVTVEDTPVRVTISLGEGLLARIDAAAAEHEMTRSGYLAAAAQRQMSLGGSPLDGATGQRLYEEMTSAGRRLQETLGPDSPVGRTLASLDGVALDGLRHLARGVSGALGTARTAQTNGAAEPRGADAAEPASRTPDERPDGG